MAEGGDGCLSKARLEAFSDGVIAVIITIMVLELKAPESEALDDLLKLWPAFAIYLVSFAFVAIYWINHHEMLSMARRATPALIWANTLLLFCLSLIPFSTAYVGATHLASLPMMIYAALQFACGLAFAAAFWTIVAQRPDEPDFLALARVRARKNAWALAAYAISILVAWARPQAAMFIFVAVAVAYVLPSLFAGEAELERR